MKRNSIVFVILLCFTVSLNAQKAISLESRKDSLSYSIGVSMAESLLKTDIDNIDQTIFFEAFRQRLNNEKTLWGLGKADSLLMEYILEKRMLKADENKLKGETFLKENAKRDGVYTTPSGLQYEILEMAKGERPSLYSKVQCTYKGMTISGKVFDKRLDEKNPFEFKVMDMIEGWVEALQMMPVGAKWRLYIPAKLAYGKNGVGSVIGANETLIFELKLVKIVSADDKK